MYGDENGKGSPGCAKKMTVRMMRPKTFMLQSFNNLQKYFSKSAKESGAYLMFLVATLLVVCSVPGGGVGRQMALCV